MVIVALPRFHPSRREVVGCRLHRQRQEERHQQQHEEVREPRERRPQHQREELSEPEQSDRPRHPTGHASAVRFETWGRRDVLREVGHRSRWYRDAWTLGAVIGQHGPMAAAPPVDKVREALAHAVRSRLGGPDGDRRFAELVTAAGPRWFAADRPIRTVHADTSMFIGGLRALLLQTLHPLAMAGVAEHSGYRTDPWGRLQRTADYLTATTFGTGEAAEATIRRVRAVQDAYTASRRTVGRTRLTIPTCCAGCTSSRSTASCGPITRSALGRSTRPVAMGTWPTWRWWRGSSACPPRRPASVVCRTSSTSSARNCAAHARPRSRSLPAPRTAAAAPGPCALRGARRGCGRAAPAVGSLAIAAAEPANAGGGRGHAHRRAHDAHPALVAHRIPGGTPGPGQLENDRNPLWPPLPRSVFAHSVADSATQRANGRRPVGCLRTQLRIAQPSAQTVDAPFGGRRGCG